MKYFLFSKEMEWGSVFEIPADFWKFRSVLSRSLKHITFLTVDVIGFNEHDKIERNLKFMDFQ